jgi:hypothetical protein
MRVSFSVAVATLSAALILQPMLLTAAPLALIDEGQTTFDPNTGLRWLDITLSTNRTYNDVSSQFGVGGDYFGYRYATSEEVSILFQNAGLPELAYPGVPGYSAEAAALISLLGPTYGDTTFGYIYGITSTPYTVGSRYLAIVYNTHQGQIVSAYYSHIQDDLASGPLNDHGSYLVEAVPLPASFVLFAIGLGFLSLFRRPSN